MACLQDLSQARGRWGEAADGFFSLFGTKVLLSGIGDMNTLEAVSRLAGQIDVPVESVSRSAWWSGRPSANTTYSWGRQARLPVDQAHSLPPGSALVVAAPRSPAAGGPDAVVGRPSTGAGRRYGDSPSVALRGQPVGQGFDEQTLGQVEILSGCC